MKDNWSTTPLGKIIELKYGKGLPQRDRVPGSYPVYGSGGIVDYHNEYFIQGPGIVVGRKGSIGTVYYEKNGFFPIDTVFYVENKDDKNDLKFIYYLLKQSNLSSLNTDAAVPGLNRNVAHLQEVELPNPLTQQKIASILSTYDGLIENNTRRIKTLEEMAQRIYREWFVHFRFSGHEKVKMVKGIPDGWENKSLGDIAEDTRRGVNPAEVDPDCPYFGLEHLPRKSIALSEWGFAKDIQSTKLLFKKGEILFGKIRPYFHKVGVAPLDGICSSDAIVIKPIDECFKYITLGCVSSTDFVNHATQTSQGTKMPRANWSVLTKYPVHIPTDNILNNFNNILEPVVHYIINLIFKIRNLRQTRDLLLPKLISGKIDVEDLDIDTGALDS